jgi:hypothetical protein
VALSNLGVHLKVVSGVRARFPPAIKTERNKMKRLLPYLSFVFACLLPGCYPAGINQTTGNSIVYKPASQIVNDSAMALLRRLIINKNYAQNPIVGKQIVCGPYLWNRISNFPSFRNVKGARVMLNVDGTLLEGKVLWDDKLISLLEYAFNGQNNDLLTIRKLNEHEIKIYWTYISFDIEEPIFMVETGSKKYIVDFTKDTSGLKLFWLDDFTGRGMNHGDFEHKGIEPITSLDLPVSIFDQSFEQRNDLPDSLYALLPFIGGNLFFSDRPSSNVMELAVSGKNRVQIPLDAAIFINNQGPETKNQLFTDLGLNISPEETKFGRFGSYCGRVDKGKRKDFGEMIMFWNNSNREGFLVCYFDRPCKIEGDIAQNNIVMDILIEKPGFYCIGNEKLLDGKTLMKEINPPEAAYYFIGIAKERQKW